MAAPKFYKANLVLLVGRKLMEVTKGQTIADRMGDENATCPECGKNEWWILPDRSAAVREGGKPYCECINCGHLTHL